MLEHYQKLWSETQLQLIEAVKQYPIIYKKRRRKRAVFNDCWKAISEKLNLPEKICKSKWTQMRTCYIRTKRENITFSKYLDSKLSFLDAEIERSNSLKKTVKKNRKDTGDKKEEVEKEDFNISTTEGADETSNDSDSREHDEIIITTLVSGDPTELLAPETHFPSEDSLNIANQSQAEEKSFEIVEFKIDVTETHLQKESLQNPDNTGIDVFGPQPVKSNNTIGIVNRIKIEDLERSDINDTPTNSKNSKRFKPDLSKPIHLESHLSNVVLKPIVVPKFEIPTGSNFIDSETSTLINFLIDDIKCELISTPVVETPTSPPCKDTKQFFSDFSSYITSKFSLEKQEDIKLRIYSLLSKEELEEFKQMQQENEKADSSY